MRTLAILCLSITLASAGEKIGRLETLDGKVFEGATVTKVEPDAITVMHSGGVARIGVEKLSIEVMERLGLSDEKARQYRADKAAAELAAAMKKKAGR